MADDADKSQHNYDLFFSQNLLARNKWRAKVQEEKKKNLPECDNECGNPVFVTPQGSVTVICRDCHTELRSLCT